MVPFRFYRMERKRGKRQDEPVQDAERQKVHNCEDMEKLAKLKPLKKLEGEDPRKKMRVRLAGCEKLSFCEAAKRYQIQYYPEAEGRAHSYPIEYALKGKIQERLLKEEKGNAFEEGSVCANAPIVAKAESGKRGREHSIKNLEEARPSMRKGESKGIPPCYTAVATIFRFLKEELADTPSFITYDYDFNTTFYRAMGIAGKYTKKRETRWKRKGFTILHGDHDVCGIVFDGERVLVLFFEVKSNVRTNEKYQLGNLVGKAEEQLKKSEEIFHQIVGRTAFTHTFLCSFLVVPYMSRDFVRKTLKCKPHSLCHEKTITEDDLETRDAFRVFLEKHGITLTRQKTTTEEAKKCYLDVMSTYVAASASVEGMPRTMEDLHQNIQERMKRALVLLTPQQRQILDDDRSVLFLAGGQGTGKTYLLLGRAQQLAEMGEKVVIVNMSAGELTRKMTDWLDSPKFHEFKDNITVMDSSEFLGGERRGIDLLLEKINDKKDNHVLIDEMQINFDTDGRDPVVIGRKWKALAEKKNCKSLWISWRPSDASYSETLDIQSVVDSLGREKVELLTEIKRSTKELGEFVIEVTQFIHKRLPCLMYLPMQGLEYVFHHSGDLGEEKEIPRVVFVRAPPTDNEVYLWTSEAAMAIQSWIPDSRILTIVTRINQERNALVRELEIELGQEVAFLDEKGKLRGHPQPRFLVFYQNQVTGMSFQNLILLDGGENTYWSWSRMVGMALESLHVITSDPLPSGHWEEPAEMGLISCCSLRKPKKSSSGVSLAPLEESSHAEISWSTFPEEKTPSLPGAECKFELLFGPNRSGKTAFLFDRLKRKMEEEDEEMRKSKDTSSRWKTPVDRKEDESGERKHRIIFVDCSRCNRNLYPPRLSLVDVKERMKKREMLNLVEVYDVHDLIQQHDLQANMSLNPQVIKELLVKMLEKGMNKRQRLHVAFDDLPVGRGRPGDTDSLRVEWEEIISSLSSHASLASLTIAFNPYIGYDTINFDVKMFKKEFHLPPQTNCHSFQKGNFVVLVSDEEIRGIFTDAFGMIGSKDGSTTREAPQIYRVEDYRGCENSGVMCVGVEDAWMVEGISRAIQTLCIVDGGTSAAAQNRMGLWMEMERRGLLLHRALLSSNVLQSLSDDDWRALNGKSLFLKIPKDTGTDEDARRETSSPEGATRIFAMAQGRDGRGGMWEVHKNTLWVYESYYSSNFFVALSGMLIQGVRGEIRILHLEGKDPRSAPHGWDHKLRIPSTFNVEKTTGVGIRESLFLLGGERNPREGHSLDLHSYKWMNLPLMTQGRFDAASLMLDPHTILVLGGGDPQKKIFLSSCECLDVRVGQWSPFPLNIPIPVSCHAATIYDDHIYISGGFGYSESVGAVWRCRANGEGPIDTLPSLRKNRYSHGMMGFGKAGLQVIGGRYQKGSKDEEVISTETLTLDGGEWKIQQEVPFINGDEGGAISRRPSTSSRLDLEEADPDGPEFHFLTPGANRNLFSSRDDRDGCVTSSLRRRCDDVFPVEQEGISPFSAGPRKPFFGTAQESSDDVKIKWMSISAFEEKEEHCGHSGKHLLSPDFSRLLHRGA
ncbi:unnamed protein product [Darwinula stevensoni]|uniref:Uncharacterized protein n=1 Tax=Darwinula stevensoni TaxID=69355 RepID=A0A7R8X7U7_9CRUS|nr:unnamed protein product [Darwinula stevensoni]CAG0887415.1 unnamed protein product [Darwinula stevensoni]